MPTARRTVIAASLGLFGAAALVTPAAAEPLTIVTTTSQIADMARNVAGERATVTALMGEGVDPHLYRQTRADVAKLRNADLVLFNGLYLEAGLEDFLLELGRQQPVIALAERLPAERLLADENYPDKHDPHVWMDVSLWASLVDELEEILAEADPEGADLFAANADAYRGELEALDSYVRDSIASIPPNARVLITAHDAFNYLAAAYDIEVMGIQGLSTESEAGLARIGELVDLLVEREIGAVFVESSVADRNIRALIEGAAARGHAASIGGELFSDAMGAPDTYEGTYLGMLDHNATVITRALGGTAPETGLNGRLEAGS
jgi:manganese/zinc/iron transport system substrate-binding protein